MPSPRPRRGPLPDLAGRTVVVTGANSGLGLETVVELAGAGADVVLCARDPARGEAARAEAARRSGSDRIELASLDLASFASIHAFAEGFLAGHDRLDVLVNNAGLVLDERRETAEGLELVMGVNHVGHHLLTRLLRERLEASAPSRVVAVSSVAHRRVLRPLDEAALAGEEGDGYDAFLQYARSKLANLLFTRELDRRVRSHGVTAVCCHPGLVRSGFGAEGDHAVIGPLVQAVGRVVMIGPARGARTQVALAGADGVEDLAGAYVVRGRVHRPSRLARDAGHAAWLWEATDGLVARAGA